jgi:molecular chaperone DnaK (HSP70)
MGRIIGIDLGTTNSVAAYWKRRQPKPIMNSDGSSLTPSVVALDQGKRHIGQDAKDRRYSGSENIVYSVKRFMGRDYDDPKTQEALVGLGYSARKAENGEVEIKLGERYYSPVEISAMILEKLKKDAEQELGEEVTHAVITVPAYFSQRQKNATREAGKLAGLNVLRIINEPTAAALAFGLEEKITEPQHILVYDFGGGTFDVSILLVSNDNYEVLNIDGDNFLGGDNLDNIISNEMQDQLRKQTKEDFSGSNAVKNMLKGHAEQVKINLSRDEQTQAVASRVTDTRRGTPVNLEYTLKRTLFEQIIAPIVKKTITITNRALEEAGLKPSEIDRVLLVGGSTRIPLVRQKLKELFGNKIVVDVDPMQCVALGAAIQTSIPMDWTCSNCNTVNEGTKDVCISCEHQHEEDENAAVIICDACGKSNRQGRLECWSCGVKIGAVLDTGDDKGEDNYIRVGDITSKHLGIEVESDQPGEENRSYIIVRKGTPFPTHEMIRTELYTTRSGQDRIITPIFEIEHEDSISIRNDWQHVGIPINDKMPPGLPDQTPVVIEVGIDADSILTVTSYVKNDREATLTTNKFHFGGKDAFKDKGSNKSPVLDDLDFNISILGACVKDSRLNKHLNPEQIEKAERIIDDAKEIIEAKDEVRAKASLESVKNQIQKLPPPTMDLFWSYLGMEDSHVSASERSQINKTILQMENTAEREDYDQANQHLRQLRELTDEMYKKLPSNLLKAARK